MSVNVRVICETLPSGLVILRVSPSLAVEGRAISTLILPLISLALMVPSLFMSSVMVMVGGRRGCGLMVMVSIAGVEVSPPLSVTTKGMVMVPLKFVVGTNTKPAACEGVRVVPSTTGVVPSA